jgi:osmotically-inducible protein OsmY
MKNFLIILCLLAATVALSSCIVAAPAAVAAVGAGATIAHNDRTTGTIVEDQAIEMRVSKALREHPELKEDARIKTVSYNNNVLLIGQVPDEQRAREIENLVVQQDKVDNVYNELEVSEKKSFIARSNDSWITTKAKAQAFSGSEVDPLRIKVITENGTVYLMGIVTREEADIATENVRQISGVQRVVRAFEYHD